LTVAAAALVVAIVAIVIAGVSAVIAWQAKNANVRQAGAAEAALHDAREPDIQLTVKQSPSTNVNADLVLSHTRGADLDLVEVEIVVPRQQDLAVGETVAVPVPGFYPGTGRWTARVDGLRLGQSTPLPINLNPNPPGKDAVFRLRCYGPAPL
jgi:hypothetical protein